MADSSSDSDDVGEKSLQKGQKRRQEESDEDSDEDSSSEVNTDGSDESFDENMEIPVEFEAFPPNEEDFNGIRCLLQQLFLKSTLDLSKLSDLIISQPEVTTLIKVVNDDDQENNGEAKTDNDDNDDESEDGVFGLTTVIDLKKHKESDVVKQLKKLLTDKCQELASKEDKTEFTEVMEGQHSVGFLINERFINIPPQIAVPVYKTLRSELKKVHKKGDDAPISYFVMICKTYKDTETKMHKKSKKVKTQESGSSLSFINVEDEVFQRESQLSFSYAASADVDETLVAGRWASSDCELKPYRTVLVLPADKFDKALEGIHNMLTQ
ncbi:protein BCCIP homolog [Pocillopora verrucosa]|uniref:protein BCCIP homolog n=1 Tax=Pocillopora verrucosa TaxID=203993 RepID=UPI003340BBFD